MKRSFVEAIADCGSFIFFLADAGGEIWVIEGCPKRIEAVECQDIISR